jgi:phage terminase large subunit-like protein
MGSMKGRPRWTLGTHVAAWIETFCVHGPGDVLGKPVELTVEERRFLAWAYEVDAEGRRLVRRAVRGLPKGSRKTEFAGWVAVAEMAGPVRFESRDGDRVFGKAVHDPFVVAAASTYEQADLLFSAARSCITEGPLSDFFDVFDREIQLKGQPGVLVRVPAVAGANDGLRPTFCVFDETHEWTGSKQRVHLVLENGLAKRQDSWSLSITTAGNPKVDSVALTQYEYGKRVAAGEVDDPGLLFSWREPKVNLDRLGKGDNLEQAIVEANPEPWKRPDDIARRFHEVPLHEAARYFLNLWVEPDDERWIDQAVWDDLKADRQVSGPVVLGFDGSYSGDSTALVLATVEAEPHLKVLGLWERPPGADGQDWTVPIGEVDAVVRRAMSDYEVVELSADPPYWSRQIEEWEHDYGAVVVRFETYVRKRMAQACSAFYQAATTGALTHDGHPGLARHVANAVLKESAQGAFITKESKSSPRKIDAAVASVVAFARAQWHHQNPTPKVNAGVLIV